MDWYWELSSLVLKDNIEPDQRGLRGELEQRVAQLYAQLLLYQMKSVCSYYRRRFSVFVRDLVKLDNWDGKLNNIKAAEEVVRQDSEQYNTVRIQGNLRDIAKTAEQQYSKLDKIGSAIQEQTKQQNAIHESDEYKSCLKDLYVTDPRDDKKRLESLKGGLLKDSYKWVLENSDFKRWRDDPQSRLLWVKADPGKGKTMLLCGIIDELQKLNTAHHPVYFFCQATDSRINSATAVLRGLVYFLVDQQPSLISHVREKYDGAGEKAFTDANAWVAMEKIFTNILNDENLEKTYLIVDALDECTTGLDALLDFIAQNCSLSSRVKWIISSRNWPNIEERLQQAGHKVKLSLELNAESVSAAVSTFIKHKVDNLANLKEDKELQEAVLKYLKSNANDTFLWVALVQKYLYWLESLSLCKAMSKGVDSMAKLEMLVQTFEGHSSSVQSVAFSHDSTRLASASSDKTVKIWDASSGACLQTLEGHSRSVQSVAFSHDSTRLASASDDNTVKIWDASSGACLQTLEGHSGYIRSVAFSHDSTRLASASSDRTVKIWDANSGACLQTLEGHSDWVRSVVFSHDSTRLASASDDKTVKIWDASSGACLQTLEGHSGYIQSVAFSHDSTRLASASDDNTVKIWDASSGTLEPGRDRSFEKDLSVEHR
ncbi:putative heterokaryon incompatibility protein [Neofusicoccum parvum UCRNP2]|uniref:Putative heterokaryon incompatibility protein n=1 Tax=Botryosphaeria parva (strain UCR-NP2) TaxID=1287680 RepID=R1GM15_BOTPV|nr:putative heterokaryon incompatibility protein [Neofusicoccum parvum UCRNP2]